MFYPSLVIAILAAIVASQALITSTFQLLSQVMNTSYFPHINLIYTSDKFHGQVYIPIANWLMMVGTVIVTAVYSNVSLLHIYIYPHSTSSYQNINDPNQPQTTRLGNAYGFCVILVTFITTNMIALVALIVWQFHPLLVLAIWLPFVALDGLYLSAALTKIPNGAWFTLLLAIILSSKFVLWRYGKEKQWSAEGRGRGNLSNLVIKNEKGGWSLPASMGGRDLNPIAGKWDLLRIPSSQTLMMI
jgi:KUP system potassium uptake protein